MHQYIWAPTPCGAVRAGSDVPARRYQLAQYYDKVVSSPFCCAHCHSWYLLGQVRRRDWAERYLRGDNDLDIEAEAKKLDPELLNAARHHSCHMQHTSVIECLPRAAQELL